MLGNCTLLRNDANGYKYKGDRFKQIVIGESEMPHLIFTVYYLLSVCVVQAIPLIPLFPHVRSAKQLNLIAWTPLISNDQLQGYT